MINMKTNKIQKPISEMERKVQIEMEKDVESYYYLYFLEQKIKSKIHETIFLDSQYNKEYMEIIESMIPKDRLKTIKRKAKEHAENDYNIIKRIL